ncbi:MAG: SMC-Scp complex subunit ScpB [Proteobacteria bacterium]|nr:SMC-Scp complex subunit ScpB [Pseudomonadota bacterium]
MNEHYLRNVIEAALLAAGRPVQPGELIELFDANARPTAEQLRAAIDALAAQYAERGIELKETAGGLRIQVRRELAGEISRLWPERPARYSRALLETLALIAYRQPLTRGEIEGVRGVAVNPNIIKTLLERNWVRVVGTRDVPGRPELLGTTRDFLDYFGLKSLDELPPLSELKAVGDINLQLDLQGSAGAKPDGETAPGVAAGIDSAGEAPASGESSESTASGEPPEPTESGEPAASADSAAAASGPEEESGADAPSAAADDRSDEALLEGSEASAVDEEEDGEDGEELSAEGGDSHELVAAPRDGGD